MLRLGGTPTSLLGSGNLDLCSFFLLLKVLFSGPPPDRELINLQHQGPRESISLKC